MIGVPSSDSSTTAGESVIHEVGSGRTWIDRLVGSDPGLNRLRSAVLSVVTIGLILAAEALFVRLTDALQTPLRAGMPAADAAKAAAATMSIW